MRNSTLAKYTAQLNITALRRLWLWLQSPTGTVVWASLLVHGLTQIVQLAFMPLPYYSELSAHDGRAYYALAYDPVPDQPAYSLMRYKRVLFALAARAAWPWDAHIGFVLVGIAGAVLANLFFYKIVARSVAQPLRLTALFACSPYLFAAAHLGLPDPVSVALTFAALYAMRENRFAWLVLCSGLALLFKEVAAIGVLALAVLVYQRDGFRRAILYLFLAGLPVVAVAALFTWAWGDWQWYLRESRSTLVPAPITLMLLATGPASPAIVRLDSVINLGILSMLGYAIWRIRRADRMLCIYALISVIPLLFLDERQYQSDFDMARQYMAVAPVLLVFSGALNRVRVWMLAVLSVGLVGYGFYYILSISTFFVMYKREILDLLFVIIGVA